MCHYSREECFDLPVCDPVSCDGSRICDEGARAGDSRQVASVPGTLIPEPPTEKRIDPED